MVERFKHILDFEEKEGFYYTWFISLPHMTFTFFICYNVNNYLKEATLKTNLVEIYLGLVCLTDQFGK